eukprot:CAMPEP_0203775296 /NCGR_PEP_ID=MMETSP0099_2-20121227/5976_1 /ASSEMBLY_ACC=CAM_ASM_000209 /TAXON_ID=96639 /ORGANISM=" , Strain NY0313808BC1" /LENGTH=434 /DNA_ID=CAMNT_0050673905 /DNA_START=707 /DNA_END=2011 /DNA_ORIENTATION=+
MSHIVCNPDRPRPKGLMDTLRRGSSGADSDPGDSHKISGPTNVKHVAGQTTGRTLVSLEEAQALQRNKRGQEQDTPPPPPPSTSSTAAATAPHRRAPTRSAPAKTGDAPAPPPRGGGAPAPPPRDVPTAGSQQPITKRPAAPTRPARPPPPGRGSDTSIAKDFANVSVSAPTNVVHKNHTTFESGKGEYHGLPKEWKDCKEASALNFGATLTSQPRIHLGGYSERIPTILVLLGRDLRRRNGFGTEGLFRISPSRTEQSKIRALLCESSSEGNTTSAIENCVDPHVLAALIKEWCRMLDGSILGCLERGDLELLSEDRFEVEPPSPVAAQKYRDLLYGDKFIPEANRAVLLWILDLMTKVVAEKDKNRMGIRAVATCFAPSLYVVDEPLVAPIDSVAQIKLITTVLVNSLHYLIYHDISAPERDVFGDKCGEFS